jgi:N4-gp56 family major capsid protein
MATIKDQFNGGKNVSTGIDEQYNDRFWSKGAKREASRKRTFTQLGDRLTQPKHWGNEIVKERQLPILHELNRLDGGIDASTATLVLNTFYAYDTTGALVGTFDSKDYTTIAGTTATEAELRAGAVLAESAATTASSGGKVQNGAGSLYMGDSDISVITGTFPSLTEEGGNVNGVNTKSITVRGNVNEFGHHLKFTQKSIDMDSRTGILAQKSKALGELKGDVYEKQIEFDLVSASELNRTFGGAHLSTTTLDQTGELTYEDLRAIEQELKRLRVPRDTKLISGTTKIGTTPVPKAFYAFVPEELSPSLEDMQNSRGENVWEDVSKYSAGGPTAEDEIGRIGRMRFIEVNSMLRYKGVGATDTGSGVGDVTGYYASTPAGGGTEKFDVFPVLFVGSDSFATVGFEGDSARIKTAMPKADAHIDPFGKNGSMSIAWYYGSLIYRPERIMQIAVTAKMA